MANQQKQTSRNIVAFIWRIPVAAILAFTPLIVYLSVRPVPKALRTFWVDDSNSDFFSFYKSRWFLCWSAVLLFSLLFLIYRRKRTFWDFLREQKVFWAACAVFAGAVLISTIFSPVPFLAWGGMFDRYEGGWAWMGYCLLLTACAFLMRQEGDFRYVAGAIVFSTAVIALVGIFQFFGMDVFRSKFGLFLILPEKFMTDRIDFEYGKGVIYSTFYNPDYGGNIGALTLPIAMCWMLFVSDGKKKAALVWGYLLLIFALAIGSRSQSGMLGLIVALTGVCLYLFRHCRDQWKRLAGIFASLIPVYVGMDRYVKWQISGKFFNRFTGKEGVLGLIKNLSNETADAFTHHAIGTVLIILSAVILWYLIRRCRGKWVKPALILVLLLPMGLGADLDAAGVLKGKPSDLYWCQKFGISPSVWFAASDPKKCEMLKAVKDKSFVERMIIKYGRFGSSRLYIYLRALDERFHDRLWLGTGPDTFAVFFPQDDVYKYCAGMGSMIVDKMHSMFLQIWFNTGLISFMAFLVMLGAHFYESVRVFWKIRVRTTVEVLGLGFFLGWIGFLGAALFNDSAISVSPYFWAVFGASAAANHVIRRGEDPGHVQQDTPKFPKRNKKAVVAACMSASTF